MTPGILYVLEETLNLQALPVGKVLEVGSQNINGTPRTIFEPHATEYIGIDMAGGSGVDKVVDAERLSEHFSPDSFDTVICCEVLEHTVRPWIVVEQMKTVLRPGGLLWISTPTFGFPLHRFPVDCYRYSEDAFRLWLFADMELLHLEQIQDDFPILVGVGRKS